MPSIPYFTRPGTPGVPEAPQSSNQWAGVNAHGTLLALTILFSLLLILLILLKYFGVGAGLTCGFQGFCYQALFMLQQDVGGFAPFCMRLSLPQSTTWLSLPFSTVAATLTTLSDCRLENLWASEAKFMNWFF